MSDREPMTTMAMTRREALKTLTVLVGGALIVPGVLAGCGRGGHAPEDERGDQALLEDIADSLLPTTAASPSPCFRTTGSRRASIRPTRSRSISRASPNPSWTCCNGWKKSQRIEAAA